MNEEIVFYILNYRKDDNARRWVNLLAPFCKIIVLDSGNDKECPDFKQFPNIYYSGLFNELLKDYRNYPKSRYTGLITSNVEIDEDNGKKLIERINWLTAQHNIGVYQPSADATSKSWLGFNDGTENIIYKGLVEGWFNIINNDVLDLIHPIDLNINKNGWGVDNVTCAIATLKCGYAVLRDNSIIVHHPKGSDYDTTIASKEGPVYLTLSSSEYEIPFSYFQGQSKDENIDNLFYYDRLELETKREHPILVTMTSWKKRIGVLPRSIAYLENQTLKPDKIIIWLSSDEISKDEVPAELYTNPLVTVKWVDKNLMCFKRYLTIKEYPNAFTFIVDDDICYPPTYLQEMYEESYRHNNKGIVCLACNPCNLLGEPWGDIYGGTSDKKWLAGGVTLYPPYMFPMEAFDYYMPIMKDESLQCDECFLMFFTNYKRTPIYTLDKNWNRFYSWGFIPATQSNALNTKFFEQPGSFVNNKKNALLKRIAQKLPEYYGKAYQEAFPNFIY